MSPLPNTRVIHSGWSEHHRPTASGSHTSECHITRPEGDGYLDEDGTWHPPSTVTLYTGECRITPASANARQVVVGEQRITVRRYEVAVEWDIPHVPIDAAVQIVQAYDPGLVGMSLRVTDVRHASETFERVLSCEEVVSSG